MIVSVITAILLSQTAILLSALHTKNDVAKKAFSIEDLISDAFISEQFNGTWISDTEIFYRKEDRLLKVNVVTRKEETIASNRLFNESGLEFYPSANGNYVLIRNITEKIYRYSSLSTYRIHNIKSNTIFWLAEGQILSTAFWAPQGNSLIYVLKNDIYYHQLEDDSTKTRRITFDGEPQVTFNGVPDWVYEEEVYDADRAMWFSPTSKHLLFVKFDDSEVSEAVILKYGKPGNLKDQYPKEERFRYPKTGTTNPRVSLNLVDLTSNKLILIPLKAPVDIVSKEHIIYTAGWLDSKTVVATWTNRVQNVSQMVTYTLTGKSNYLLKQESPGGWLIHPEQIPILYGEYLLLMKLQCVESQPLGLFSHVTRFTLVDGVLKDETDLTPGGFWVHEINGFDAAKRFVFFTASPPGEPSQRRLYEVNFDGDGYTKTKPRCISCVNISTGENECRYVSSICFSMNYSHYVMTCDGPEPATIKIRESESHREFYDWSNNDKVRKNLAERNQPKIMDLYVESHGFNSKVRLLLPHDFDETKKYPMLVTVYAGPESQQINDKFAVNFGTYMTSNRKVIHASIDGRGSSSRGTAMMYAVYRNLGGTEIDDQIIVTKKLQEKFSWIDANRTGIWGRSYGGYSSARALTKDQDGVFKCGISVAPITDWIYYDSVLTERYMGLPSSEDNLENYKSSSVVSLVEKFRGKKFMLVHGTGDDNVHFQHSMVLSSALAEADILYNQMTYPDEAHSLAHVQKHLYGAMDKFWAECFDY